MTSDIPAMLRDYARHVREHRCRSPWAEWEITAAADALERADEDRERDRRESETLPMGER